MTESVYEEPLNNYRIERPCVDQVSYVNSVKELQNRGFLDKPRAASQPGPKYKISFELLSAIGAAFGVVSILGLIITSAILTTKNQDAVAELDKMREELMNLRKNLSSFSIASERRDQDLHEEITKEIEDTEIDLKVSGARQMMQLNQTISDFKMTITRDIFFIKRGFCKVSYGSSCFTVVKPPSAITLTEGRTKCQEIGGRLANIYSREHFDQMVSLLRQSIKIGWSMVNAWTGMTLNTRNRMLFLSDGRQAPYAKWMAGRPYKMPLPNVGINVNQRTDFTNQGYFDEKSTTLLMSALCEL